MSTKVSVKHVQSREKHASRSGLIKGSLVTAAIIIIVVVSLKYAGVLSFQPTPPATTATSYNLAVQDYVSAEDITDDVSFNWYEKNIENVDAADIEKLKFTDFTAVSGDESLEPDEDCIYVLKLNMTDRDDLWLTTNPSVGKGKMAVLSLGDNVVKMMNSTEDVSMLALPTGSFAPTVLNTDYDEWMITTRSLDGAEGVDANLTTKEGFLPYYDFQLDKTLKFVIRIAFNTTVDGSESAFNSMYTYDVTNVNGANNYTYYEIDAAILGEQDFSISFDDDVSTGIGAGFEVLSIAVGYGYVGAVSVWDTQV